jgi:predicted phage tail protein
MTTPSPSPVPQPSPEMLELLERRLADSVGDRVERTLKVRYASILAAVLALVGVSGWGAIQSQVNNLVGNVLDPVRREAERAIEESKLRLESLRETQGRVAATTEKVEEQIAAGERRLEAFQARLTKQQDEFDRLLETMNDQFAAALVRRRELEADIARTGRAVEASLAATRAELAGLARLTGELAALAAEGRPGGQADAARFAAETAAIAERSQSAFVGDLVATVFVQYDRAVPAKVAADLAQRLRAARYVVPGEDQVPTEAREVRFFAAADREAADRLAREAEAALEAMGLGRLPVEVKDLSAYDKAKPRAGTLELWLALPPGRA